MIGLTALNLDGDDQADRTVHGGLDKAVYAHPAEHLPVWAVDLGSRRWPNRRCPWRRSGRTCRPGE